MNNKSPFVAFFLSFIPGMGHIYLNQTKRGIFYLFCTIIPLIGFAFLAAINPWDAGILIIMGIGFAFFVGFLNLLDMVFYLIKKPLQNVNVQNGVENKDTQVSANNSERLHTMLLSFVPGLGHFYLGLMNRGLTFLIGFFGLGVMVIFIAAITSQGGFIAFLGILPVIWIFNMFDTMQQLSRKQNGEELVDRTVLEDFEETRKEQGRKSKALATILSMFPGAGHMYLGLQRRGLQLMAAFLFSIYILDTLRLSLFLFLIPLIWFYSFFDALQKVSKHGDEELEDIPIVSYLINHQKWVGIGLIVLGIYYMFTNIVVPVLGPVMNEAFGVDFNYWYYQYFQMIVISIIFIGGGIKLLIGSKSKRKEQVS